ncbi:MAG: RsmB/NOP family class I SAM-dependent RNA methyltransferase [Desulfovibrio sp.]|nr:MAG: RsmB/NOP family class I SAM-dependent RNA methyltransferase [Desulfovibrio sp.]
MRSFRAVTWESGPVLELLHSQGFSSRQDTFWELAFGADQEPMALGASLAAAFGLLYIQDRSSMLPPLALSPPPGARVLDMCASPGGKTGILSLLVGEQGLVVGNEPNSKRLATLRANLLRMNAANTITCSYPGQELPFHDESWDYILLDPPCSGWGTVDKHPRVRTLWREDKVKPLIGLQRALLAKAARMLAPGGKLLYSTCTTNPAENEDQVIWVIEELGLEVLPLEPFAGFSFERVHGSGHGPTQGALRVDGEASMSQGFFLAKFTKPGKPMEQDTSERWRVPRSAEQVDPSRLSGPECDWSVLPIGRTVVFSERLMLLTETALESVPPELRWQGFPLGRVRGREFRPHPLARLLLPEPGARDSLNVESIAGLEDLVAGRALVLPGKETRPKQLALFYQDLGLGWAVAKGSRVLWSDKESRFRQGTSKEDRGKRESGKAKRAHRKKRP